MTLEERLKPEYRQILESEIKEYNETTYESFNELFKENTTYLNLIYDDVLKIKVFFKLDSAEQIDELFKH